MALLAVPSGYIRTVKHMALWRPPGLKWCSTAACTPLNSCWIGSMSSCQAASGWVSRGRNASAPSPPAVCTDPGCLPSTNDSSWRSLNLPHDFVVEGNFSQGADMAHGYLPFGAWCAWCVCACGGRLRVLWCTFRFRHILYFVGCPSFCLPWYFAHGLLF